MWVAHCELVEVVPLEGGSAVAQTTEDPHAPKPMAIVCPDCDAPVLGEPRGYMTRYEPQEGPPERWTLLQCPRYHPLLALQEQWSGQEFDDDPPGRMYPPRERFLSQEIPAELREAHDEARRCFSAKAYAATVVMCGRTVEAVCTLHGVDKGTLEKSLLEMKTQQLIDGRLWEWADTLRDVRNAAAHYGNKTLAAEPITRVDAQDSLAFSEALLDYLYVLAARFDAMRQRRAKP